VERGGRSRNRQVRHKDWNEVDFTVLRTMAIPLPIPEGSVLEQVKKEKREGAG